MTGCAQFREPLLDRALGLPASAELEAHLKACPSCSASLAAWRATVDVEPSPFLATRILAQVERHKPAWRWKAAMAALASLAVLALLVLRVNPREEIPPEVVALSHWQSPTASLLRSTADPLLKTVPRLGQEFKP